MWKYWSDREGVYVLYSTYARTSFIFYFIPSNYYYCVRIKVRIDCSHITANVVELRVAVVVLAVKETEYFMAHLTEVLRA